MRGIRDKFKALDFVFAHEEEFTDLKWHEVISASYEKIREKNVSAAELASRRYRRHEHRFKTCRQLFISESQYYKLLGAFLQTAKAEEERIFLEESKTAR